MKINIYMVLAGIILVISIIGAIPKLFYSTDIPTVTKTEMLVNQSSFTANVTTREEILSPLNQKFNKEPSQSPFTKPVTKKTGLALFRIPPPPMPEIAIPTLPAMPFIE